MKMLSVALNDSYVKAIDELIAFSKIYTSRSEFLKDSIRKNIEDTMKLNNGLQSIHNSLEELVLKAKQRGYTGKKISQKERDKLAREFLKEKGIM